jgi:hypothetical protein
MIVAVGAMGVMQVPTYQIIKVVPMRCAFMPALWAVNMFSFVPFAFMVGRAGVRVGAIYGNGVLIDVVGMRVMQVTIMKIVRMPIVTHRRVPAIRAVLVSVC